MKKDQQKRSSPKDINKEARDISGHVDLQQKNKRDIESETPHDRRIFVRGTAL
jgi:hypothetical protein